MAKSISIKNFPVGYQSMISNGRHSIFCDEPTKSKGTDLGFSPEDLLMSSLAMCKVATVRYIARKNGWDTQIRDIDAQLSMNVKRGNGGFLTTSVAVAIKIEGDISEDQKQELLKQADSCYIHRMIEGDWEIESATQLVEA